MCWTQTISLMEKAFKALGGVFCLTGFNFKASEELQNGKRPVGIFWVEKTCRSKFTDPIFI